VTDVLSKVESLLDDFLTIVRVQYSGRSRVQHVSLTCVIDDV